VLYDRSAWPVVMQILRHTVLVLCFWSDVTCCAEGVHAASDILDGTQLFEIWNSFQKLILALASTHIATISRSCWKISGVRKVLRLCIIDGRWINNYYKAIFGIILTTQIQNTSRKKIYTLSTFFRHKSILFPPFSSQLYNIFTFLLKWISSSRFRAS
jgi:hypothetical protein